MQAMGVHIRQVEFRENVRTFSQGKNFRFRSSRARPCKARSDYPSKTPTCPHLLLVSYSEVSFELSHHKISSKDAKEFKMLLL